MIASHRILVAVAVAVVLFLVAPAFFVAGAFVALLVLVISPIVLLALAFAVRGRPPGRHTRLP